MRISIRYDHVLIRQKYQLNAKHTSSSSHNRSAACTRPWIVGGPREPWETRESMLIPTKALQFLIGATAQTAVGAVGVDRMHRCCCKQARHTQMGQREQDSTHENSKLHWLHVMMITDQLTSPGSVSISFHSSAIICTVQALPSNESAGNIEHTHMS